MDAVVTTLKGLIEKQKLDKPQLIPGMIIAWKGSINSIPAGWKLCQELKGRFILGANDQYKVGDKAGVAEHKLTVEEMPEHNHYYTAPLYSSTNSTDNRGAGRGLWSLTETKSYPVTKEGGNKAHNNMPPYYALAYIEYVGEKSTVA